MSFVSQSKYCLFHCDFYFLKNVLTKTYVRTFSSYLSHSDDNNSDVGNETKTLKVAIIGVPNVGKSTLINKIIGRHIFGVSSKIHTTRCKARGILIDGNTQVVFLDTPGVVSPKQSAKYRLESSFLKDGEEAIQEADLIGVVHDSSNEYTKYRLDSKILRLLVVNSDKDSFLILNKIDIISTKKNLLSLSQTLTNGRLKTKSHLLDRERLLNKNLTETEIADICNNSKGWPYFKDIFMVSGLTGNGVGDIRAYLLDHAKPGNWPFSASEFTDQDHFKFIEHVIFCKLLDNLPNEIPYNVKIGMEYFSRDSSDTVIAVLLLGCSSSRAEKVVMGNGGSRIKKIALEAERDLRHFFLSDVRLKLVVTSKYKVTKSPIPLEDSISV